MTLPDHAVLTDLAEKVCSVWEVPVPEITWRAHKVAHAHETGITLPSREWILEYQVADGHAYALLMLHELAHWILNKKLPYGMQLGHTKTFYAFLFSLVADWGETYGITPASAMEDEITYKPRGAKAGWRLFMDLFEFVPDEVSA